MLKILIKAVFKLIELLGSLLVAPIFALINPFLSALGLQTYYNSFTTWFTNIFSYFNFAVAMLHIPRVALAVVFSFGATIFTFNISLRAIALVQAIYRTVKKG